MQYAITPVDYKDVGQYNLDFQMHIYLIYMLIFTLASRTLTETCDSSREIRCSSDSKSERTFIALKPDAVQRGLVGEIVTRFERKGFKLVAMKLVSASEKLLHSHYQEHEGKSFFSPLVSYMRSGPVLATVWSGKGVVAAGRAVLGATNPLAAAPGTIRGDLGLETGRNLCHASDSVDSAEREIGLWFSQDEIVGWNHDLENWIHE